MSSSSSKNFRFCLQTRNVVGFITASISTKVRASFLSRTRVWMMIFTSEYGHPSHQSSNSTFSFNFIFKGRIILINLIHFHLNPVNAFSVLIPSKDSYFSRKFLFVQKERCLIDLWEMVLKNIRSFITRLRSIFWIQ